MKSAVPPAQRSSALLTLFKQPVSVSSGQPPQTLKMAQSCSFWGVRQKSAPYPGEVMVKTALSAVSFNVLLPPSHF